MTGPEVVAEAEKLIASRAFSGATALLQSALNELPRTPENRQHRANAFRLLLGSLYSQGREARMLRVLRNYTAEFESPDLAFDRDYEAGLLATKTSPLPMRRRERFRILVGQLERTQHLDGLVAECGCFQGLSSFVMCSRLRRDRPSFDGTGYEIYDSFQGLSELGPADLAPLDAQHAPPSDAMHAGRFAASLEEVRRALAGFPGITYFPGWIPGTFDSARDKRYRFVHVDVDLYEPTLASFAYFWPRLMPGGVIVCDDYDWPGARRAVEEFCRDAGVAFDVTPQSQACFARSA